MADALVKQKVDNEAMTITQYILFCYNLFLLDFIFCTVFFFCIV